MHDLPLEDTWKGKVSWIELSLATKSGILKAKNCDYCLAKHQHRRHYKTTSERRQCFTFSGIALRTAEIVRNVDANQALPKSPASPDFLISDRLNMAQLDYTWPILERCKIC